MSFRDNPYGGSQKITGNFTTNGDLTAKQYFAAKIFDSLTVGLASATTDELIGIIDNIPLSGTGASVRIVTGGLAFAVAGAAFTAGAALTVDANGQVVALTTSTQVKIGTAYTSASAASEVASIFVNVSNDQRPGA